MAIPGSVATPGNPTMKTLYIGVANPNRLTLDTFVDFTQEKVESVKVTIVNEAGTVATDDGGQPLQDKAVDITTGKKRFVEFKFHADTEPGYFRAYWVVMGGNDRRVELESYNSPEALRVKKTAEYNRELVSPALVRNMFLKNIPMGGYGDDDLREIIQSAQGELEDDIQITLSPHQVLEEKHDYYHEQFVHTFWLKQFYEFPIISLDAWTIKYSDHVVLDLDPPESFIQVEKDMGTAELIPLAAGQSGWLYTMLFSGLSALGVSIFGGFERIPLFFHFDYTTGIDFDNIPVNEKSKIRTAIARRAAIEVLPKIDAEMGIASRSVSIDGVSETTSLTSSAMYGQYSAQITQYMKQDARWVEKMRRRYMKDGVTVVA